MSFVEKLSIKRRICACVLAVLLVANMGVIFFLSSEDATTSSDRSNPIADAVVKVEEQHSNLGRPMIPEEKKDAVADMQFWVRSAAHFLEFFALGWLACALLLTLRVRPWWLAAASSAAFGVLYAVSDEVHQNFVEGRNAAISDVILDSLGVVCGVVLALVVVQTAVRILSRRRGGTVCS